MDTITLNNKKYELVPIEKLGKLRLVQTVNGIQRLSKDFNNREEMEKFMKRKGIIIIPMADCDTTITVTWIH